MTVMATHVHRWSAEPPERSWPPGEAALAHRPTPLGRDELLREMDAASVDRASIGLSSWEGDRNDLAMEAVLLHPACFAIMRRLAIEWSASRRPVNTWKYRAGMLGVRLTFHRGVHRSWLTDGTTAWFWAAAERPGIAVVVFASGLHTQIAAVAARHSGLRLVLDYLALSGDIQDAAPGPARRPALVLAQYPNVAVKAPRCRATSPKRILIQVCTHTSALCSRRMDRNVSFGELIWPGCVALIVRSLLSVLRKWISSPTSI
jgi:hypothetical protein